MIDYYEIGGNEVKVDGSEAIGAIPENRTLLVEQLTSEEPVNPEVVTGLTTVEQVFDHYKPQVNVEFRDVEGMPVRETFHFRSVGDFSVKNMTDSSAFLKGLSIEKNFYGNLIRQLRSNKVLQRALENQETKQALIDSLQSILTELQEVKNESNEH